MRFHWCFRGLGLAGLLLGAATAWGQGAVSSAAPAAAPKPLPGSITSHVGWPAARPQDVTSVEAIVGALYDVISGPAGQARDWDRMRSLFVPDARLIPVRVLPGSPSSARPGTDVVYLSVEDYIARSSPAMLSQGFFERGVHNETAEFGNMVEVFSTYESRHAKADAAPFSRGINSIQLLRDGGRYWIVNVMWDAERPGSGIPGRYLPVAAGPGAGLAANFDGEWVGTLEYRDFGNNQRVVLPAWLTMTAAAGGDAVRLAYSFDDGPTKTVHERETLTLDAAAGKAVLLGEEAGSTAENYTVTGLAEFARKGRGVLTLTGPGIENSKPVEVRLTLELRRNLYTLRKETRAAGGEFAFRDAYTFTRVGAP